MELVPASHFTAEQLTDIYNRARADYIVPMPMTVQRLLEYVHVYDIDLDGSVVALEGEEALGLCMLGVRAGRGWITRLGVLLPGRRRGVGQAMVEFCLDYAARRGLSLITLEVITGNTPAYALFQKLGFADTRKLLILRRPPGPPPDNPNLPPATLTWLDEAQTIAYASTCPWTPAWINQIESIINAGRVKALHLVEHSSELSGWVTYEQSLMQLRRIILAPDSGVGVAPAHNLLYHLHVHFPALDSIAENVPADIPCLDAFYAYGYVEAFSRVEMQLILNP